MEHARKAMASPDNMVLSVRMMDSVVAIISVQTLEMMTELWVAGENRSAFLYTKAGHSIEIEVLGKESFQIKAGILCIRLVEE